MRISKYPVLGITVILFLGTGIFLALHNQDNLHLQSNASPILPVPSIPPPTNTPTPQPVQDTKVSSPDNSKILTLRKSMNTYSLFTSTTSGELGTNIYTKTLGIGSNITIPGNAWSPDDLYFFLQDNEKGSTGYFVFKANGYPFKDGNAYLDLVPLFAQHNSSNSIKEVTGWAAPGLVIVNSLKSDNTDGPSFWFEVSSQSFIQLATHF